MKAPLLFFLVLVLASSNASAGWLPAPFNILEEKVFDGDWCVADKCGTPIKDVKTSQHIRGWIDIIGFRNETIIDDTRYVNGSAKDFAIVGRDAWHTPVKGKTVSFISTYYISDSGNTTTATQNTTFHWKYKKCTLIGCHWVHVWEYLHIASIVDSPETFNNSVDDYEITITSYNNSVTPYTLIYVPQRENIIKQSVYYKNDTASWYNFTGLVKENNRGTEHVRFLNKTGFSIDENETITRRGGYFVINEAPLNWSLLDISVFTPYIEKTDSVCNATIYDSKPSDFVAGKPIIIFLGILASFLVGVFIVVRRT
jgi:hypothetical protein